MSERHEASRAIQRSRAQAAHARERWYDERLEHDRYSSGSECSAKTRKMIGALGPASFGCAQHLASPRAVSINPDARTSRVLQ